MRTVVAVLLFTAWLDAPPVVKTTARSTEGWQETACWHYAAIWWNS